MSLRDKLALFLNILRAVAFAHARLIVHRDLKPNNILIAAGCDVRLLDFGIARLLQPDTSLRPQQAANHTIVGAAALTPAYAAPEQFIGQAVTVATDVYSLGVILFELLTGCSPYSPKGRSLGAYEHEVRFIEPPLMSRAARPAEAGALRGDLDAIVAKALEKKPEDRYPSVEAFAADIERHLAAQPIAARPRSFNYVARKFVRRNLLPLGIATFTVTVLSVSLGLAAWQWRDAERQRAMAVDRLANSDAAATFTSTVLIEGMQPGESLTFEQLIARSEEIARQTGRNDVRSRIFATQFPLRLVSRQRHEPPRRGSADAHHRFPARGFAAPRLHVALFARAIPGASSAATTRRSRRSCARSRSTKTIRRWPRSACSCVRGSPPTAATRTNALDFAQTRHDALRRGRRRIRVHALGALAGARRRPRASRRIRRQPMTNIARRCELFERIRPRPQPGRRAGARRLGQRSG